MVVVQNLFVFVDFCVNRSPSILIFVSINYNQPNEACWIQSGSLELPFVLVIIELRFGFSFCLLRYAMIFFSLFFHSIKLKTPNFSDFGFLFSIFIYLFIFYGSQFLLSFLHEPV